MAFREWRQIQLDLSRTLWAFETRVTTVVYAGYQARVQQALDTASYNHPPLSLSAVPGQRGPAATLPDCSIVVTSSATPCVADVLRFRERTHAAKCERLKGIFDLFTSWMEYLTVEEWVQLEIESCEQERYWIDSWLQGLVRSCQTAPLQYLNPRALHETLAGERLLRGSHAGSGFEAGPGGPTIQR